MNYDSWKTTEPDRDTEIDEVEYEAALRLDERRDVNSDRIPVTLDQRERYDFDVFDLDDEVTGEYESSEGEACLSG